jgi:hypothetical protein
MAAFWTAIKTAGTTAIITAILTAIITALVNYLVWIKQFRESNKLAFAKQQLVEFYSPILGCITKIRALSENRFNLSKQANAVWQEEAEQRAKPEIEPHKKQMDYNNQQLLKEILPEYEKILVIFQEKHFLTFKSTRDFYNGFSDFVDIWRRHLAKSIPFEVEMNLGHKELLEFYEEVKMQFERLQEKLAGKI